MTNRAVPARVWITGASSGLGAALAREYAAHGATVLLTARPGPRLEAICAELAPAAISYAVDVTQAGALAATIAQMGDAGHLPELAILNAGTYRPMGLNDFDTAAMVDLFSLNFFAVARTIELLVPAFRRRGYGHIAVVGSVAGDIGLPYAGAYSASKAALMRLCQSLRPEFERSGLALSIINPGFIATPLTARNQFPMPFIVTAEQAAQAIRRGLARKRFEIRFPFAMSVTMRLLAALPTELSHQITRRLLQR